jgi:hypothetical protein
VEPNVNPYAPTEPPPAPPVDPRAPTQPPPEFLENPKIPKAPKVPEFDPEVMPKDAAPSVDPYAPAEPPPAPPVDPRAPTQLPPEFLENPKIPKAPKVPEFDPEELGEQGPPTEIDPEPDPVTERDPAKPEEEDSGQPGEGGDKPPDDDYDVEAWEKYYEKHPEVKRSVGAAGENDPRLTKAAGGPFSGATDEEIDEALSKMKADGEPIELQRHGQASTARKQKGVTGDMQSAHVTPRSAMRKVPGYDADDAFTKLLPSDVHRSMDAYWKSQFRAMQAAGKSTATAQEVCDVVAESIRRAVGISDGTKASLIARLQGELFMDLGLKPGDVVELPYAR